MLRSNSTSLPSGLVALVLQMLACSFLWATAFLFIKVIGRDVSPLALTALRGLLGALVLGFWIMALGQVPRPRGREWRDWAVLGLLQGIVPNTLTAFALATLPTGLTALLQSSTPLIVAVLAPLVFAGERLTLRIALGLALGFAGLGVLLAPSLAARDGSLLGVVAMLVTALSYALGNLYVPSILHPRPLRLAFGQQAVAGLPTLALVLTVSGPAPFAPALAHTPALLGLGVLATALPIVLYMNVLRLAGPMLGSMYAYLIPVWTVLLAALRLGESVTARDLTGGAIVLAGLIIVALAKRARRAMPPSRRPNKA